LWGLWAGEYLCEEGDKEGVREKKILKTVKKMIGTVRTDRKLRRNRVQAKLLEGFTVREIAESEGFSMQTIFNDIDVIGRDAILAKSQDVVDKAFKNFAYAADWATEEAVKIHEASSGRLDCLNFVVRTQKEKLGVAQSLGLLEKVAERTESEVNLNVKIPEKVIKDFGDYLAKNLTEDADEV
jgi:hypothetical protein